MSQPYMPEDPTPDHLADTGPIQTIRNPGAAQSATGWQRWLGLFSLFGATVLTIGAMLMMLLPNDAPPPPPDQPAIILDEGEDTTPIATATPQTDSNDTNNTVGEPVA